MQTVPKPTVYIIGSLRNPSITELGASVRAVGYDVFDDWHAAGPIADDEWRRYEKERGHTYSEALVGLAAQHVLHFDLQHLNRASVAILALPAGRSGHLELGYIVGQGKRGYVLLDQDYDRWDVMYGLASGVFDNKDELLDVLRKNLAPRWTN